MVKITLILITLLFILNSSCSLKNVSRTEIVLNRDYIEEIIIYMLNHSDNLISDMSKKYPEVSFNRFADNNNEFEIRLSRLKNSLKIYKKYNANVTKVYFSIEDKKDNNGNNSGNYIYISASINVNDNKFYIDNPISVEPDIPCFIGDEGGTANRIFKFDNDTLFLIH